MTLKLEVQIGTPLRREPYRPQVTPRAAKRPRGQRGLFVVTRRGETFDGRIGRYHYPAQDYDTSRTTYYAAVAEVGTDNVGWHRAERIPDAPPGVVDCVDLAEVWARTATTPREQLCVKLTGGDRDWLRASALGSHEAQSASQNLLVGFDACEPDNPKCDKRNAEG